MPASSAPTCVDPAAVAAVLAAVDPAPLRVVLFGSRARGDFDGHSDVDLIAVGTTQQDAEAVADALADAGKSAGKVKIVLQS